MSSPLPIHQAEHGISTTPATNVSVLGSSPRSQPTPVTAARKFYKRLLYDATVDASQFSVGLLETKEQAERKSGAEAWSLRLHSSVHELSFQEFTARFSGEDVPFHRIAYYKQNGVVVWEAENLLKKTGDYHHHHHHNGHHNTSSRVDAPPVQALCSTSITGCSPPAGSFMARLAAAGTPGLPPRGSTSQVLDYSSSFTAATSSSKRLSTTDYGTSPHSWSGSSPWSAGAAGVVCLSGGPPFAAQTPLGTSPSGNGYCTPGSSAYGTSPRVAGGLVGSAAGGILSSASRPGSYVSPSPGGSCSSSWTATSPLTAAVVAGVTSLQQCVVADAGRGDALHVTPITAELQAAEGMEVVSQLQEPELADYSMLPEECWLMILQQLGVKELCVISRVNRALKALAARSFLWSSSYERLFGTAAPDDWSAPTVKRLCRRSELRASRWLEADVEWRTCGFSGTWCCQLDDTKVVSGDGCAVRLWSHDSGRRIATLRGHTGRVTAVAFDDELIVSGCSQGTVKLWSMDELKLSKTLRHHTGPVSAAVLLHGLPITGSKDGSICVWDAAAPNTPLVVLEAGSSVQALELQEEKGHLLSAGSSVGVYDMGTAQLLFNLQAPSNLQSLSTTSSDASALHLMAEPVVDAEDAAAAVAALDLSDDGADADAEDGVLLQDVWLYNGGGASSDESDDEQLDADGGTAAAHGAGAQPAGAGKPFTSISCFGNLVAAGRAGGVVLWDLRSQDPVGSVKPSHPDTDSSSGPLRPPNAPCVGVQLDEWKLVTGWAGSGGSSMGGGSSCWWRSSADVAGVAQSWDSVGHSLEVYDIRAALGCGAFNTAGSKGTWSQRPVMSLPVPNRVTCFQSHKEQLLVGQEGADCCLLSFTPPGSSITRAAVAWGYAGSSRAAAGHSAGYGMSPNGMYEDSGNTGDSGAVRSGGKGKKKGAAKVPAKKQTRYPKRTTR